ncbi:MAG: hypothetical protein H0T59_05610 [Chloroflexi bacterium]|nr:hypothetical protein [Chloroflexota bacterium]
MPYQREGEIVLAMWREAERELTAVDGIDVDRAEELRADVARLRDEYQRLIALADQQHRPAPPPVSPET